MIYRNLPLGLLLKTVQVVVALGTIDPKLETGVGGLRIVDDGKVLLAAMARLTAGHAQLWSIEIFNEDNIQKIEGKVSIAQYREGGWVRPVIGSTVNPFLLTKNAAKLRSEKKRLSKESLTADDYFKFKVINAVYMAGGIIDQRTGIPDPVMAIGGYMVGGYGYLVGMNFSNNKDDIRRLDVFANGNVFLIDSPIDCLYRPRESSLQDIRHDDTMTNIRARCLTHNAYRNTQRRGVFDPLDRYFDFFLYWNENGTTEWTRFDKTFA
jgi:hypothetical protein